MHALGRGTNFTGSIGYGESFVWTSHRVQAEPADAAQEASYSGANGPLRTASSASFEGHISFGIHVDPFG